MKNLEKSFKELPVLTKEEGKEDELMWLVKDVVVAHLANTPVESKELPTLITEIYNKVSDLAKRASKVNLVPAIPPEDSVTDDYIICLEDGKKLKMLKRYIKTYYNMSPDEYRKKWGLHNNYPMVAPSYGKVRSKLAKQFELGKKK